jgi:hypothetical protein
MEIGTTPKALLITAWGEAQRRPRKGTQKIFGKRQKRGVIKVSED